MIYCAHNKIIFTPLGWFPISYQGNPRQTSYFTNILIDIYSDCDKKGEDLFLLQLLCRHYLATVVGSPALHCSSCCQLTGIKKINRTATFAGVHSFLLGCRINWGRIIRDGEFVIVLLLWPGGGRLVNYAENMRSQSGFRISEFQHWIGGTKPRQSLTRRAKFDEMCDYVALHNGRVL